jgi:hypothetical protein
LTEILADVGDILYGVISISISGREFHAHSPTFWAITAFILALMIMSLLIMAHWRIEKCPANFMTWTHKLVVIAVTWGIFVLLSKTRGVKHSERVNRVI